MRINKIFGELSFNQKVMEERLSSETYQNFMETLHIGKPLDRSLADNLAHSMKVWAIEQGATHFTHWFQPLRGGTAEKHDAFISYNENGHLIEHFSGSQLIQSEPDASSFPSGGIRSTFEARGYTAWDPSSEVFLLESGHSKTLVIPSVFLSWTGMVLDHKTPFLRSHLALENSVIRLQRLLGNRHAKRVIVHMGLEQEYFLVPKDLYLKRRDLQITGRTLFGLPAAKGQQMEDHYLGTIKPKVLLFMEELDQQLYRLGIPAKTRHNEVAPNQFEIAPLFEEGNRAIDHNLQIMNLMEIIADKHGLTCLLHEKPFQGINGSGKHLNWSIGDNTGSNYLEPSASPLKNITFLMTLSAILLGVHKYGGLLRASVADAGNDLRLGSNEAPPAIMSVYLGSYLTKLLEDIEDSKAFNEKKISEISLGIRRLPMIQRDTSDRNRTSPIAFTGNKFEFRAAGSSQNCSESATVINLMLTYGFDYVYKELSIMSGDSKQNALKIIKSILSNTKDIRFEGNNYDDQWVIEAQKKGLPYYKQTPHSLEELTKEETIKLYKNYGVLSKTELESKKEIRLDHYCKTKINEFKTAVNLCHSQILPCVEEYISEISDILLKLKELEKESPAMQDKLEILLKNYEEIQKSINFIEEQLIHLSQIANFDAKAKEIHSKLEPSFIQLRGLVDSTEKIIPGSLWPLPSYQDLLSRF
ncbi:MAG: glutamine synthetase III [Spirochaetales bacterium]|nr:glutamine synthetase III [Spirochaetales bacterium]